MGTGKDGPQERILILCKGFILVTCTCRLSVALFFLSL